MRLVGGLRRRRRAQRGQALVEFSLVLMTFMTAFVSLVEFSFAFTAWASIGYASHDAAQMAATYGNTAGADCAVLERIDGDIGAPANRTLITTVDIYLVDTSTNGNPVGGKENIWTYDGGHHDCNKPDGTLIQIPFTIGGAALGYPESDRCNVNQGIGCPSGRLTVDTIGVKITYQYQWMTPFPKLVGGVMGPGPTLTQTTIMRLEPVR